MLGAIIGDIVGSTREGKKSVFDGNMIISNTKNMEEFKLPKPEPIIHEGLTFTDDTVLTLATARALRTETKPVSDRSFAESYLDFFDIHSKQSNLYKGPGIGYGMYFIEWTNRHFIKGEKIPAPYGSLGNGSAMRVPPVSHYSQGLVEVVNLARSSAMCTHNHPEGVRWAQALAAVIYLARKGLDVDELRAFMDFEFNDWAKREFDEENLVEYYEFSSTCEDTVPLAIWAALEGPDFESVMKRCLRIGGDTDTIACMAGSLAEVLYGIPDSYSKIALKILERDGPYLYDEYHRNVDSGLFGSLYNYKCENQSKDKDNCNSPVSSFIKRIKTKIWKG
tara:strand:+ start:1198 stop:2205 length:1008 start_codon:yes stop_codon:yes gene_type:complete